MNSVSPQVFQQNLNPNIVGSYHRYCKISIDKGSYYLLFLHLTCHIEPLPLLSSLADGAWLSIVSQ